VEVVLFRVRTRDGVDVQEYSAAFLRMLDLVQTIPGFVSFDGFSGEDGSELAVATFEDEAAVAAWRDHPEHVATRRRGREEFFDSYDITVARITRRYGWDSGDGPPQGQV
jgi:heme-degrading monooxygenase HmoA